MNDTDETKQSLTCNSHKDDTLETYSQSFHKKNGSPSNGNIFDKNRRGQ